MKPKIDYQLKHQIYGRNGSLWERQANDATRRVVRSIVKQAGNASTLTLLDQTAASSINADEVLREDTYFNFIDGNFATVGRYQTDYAHTETTLSDGSKVYTAYRPLFARSSQNARANVLANISRDFVDSIVRDNGQLSDDRDWYLIPVPKSMVPIIIAGRNGAFLTSGIDFLARDGYIATPSNPAEILPAGVVRVLSSYKKVKAPNSYVLDSPTDRRGTKWLSDYTYRTQSTEAFKRAAAEYAGMYVFQTPDYIIDAQNPTNNTWVYVCAEAGTVVIRYPHNVLRSNQSVQPGKIISRRFEIVVSEYNGSSAPLKESAASWPLPFKLDGIFPVQGVTWDGRSMVTADSVETNPATGDPIIRLHFDEESSGAQYKLWAWQKQHELQTGVSLYLGLGSPSLPAEIDFWDVLHTFYGTQLLLITCDFHGPVITERLRRFIYNERPSSTSFVIGINMTPDEELVSTDDEGFPLVDDNGDYVIAGGEGAALGYGGRALTLSNGYVSYTR